MASHPPETGTITVRHRIYRCVLWALATAFYGSIAMTFVLQSYYGTSAQFGFSMNWNEHMDLEGRCLIAIVGSAFIAFVSCSLMLAYSPADLPLRKAIRVNYTCFVLTFLMLVVIACLIPPINLVRE